MFQFPPTPVIDDPMIKVGLSDLTKEAMDRIVGYGDTIIELGGGMDGSVGFVDRKVDYDSRISKVAWIRPFLKETNWIFCQVRDMVLDANARFFHYDLFGFHDALQYTVYYGSKNGHFNWHMDSGDSYGGPQRKLSISILLSDPDEYEGGDFQFFDGWPHTVTHKERGTMIIFPSWLQHRVTPVTKGVRKALVGWVCGPKFR